MSLGQLAWDTYSVAVGRNTFDGKPLPTWDQLGERQSRCKHRGLEADAEEIALGN